MTFSVMKTSHRNLYTSAKKYNEVFEFRMPHRAHMSTTTQAISLSQEACAQPWVLYGLDDDCKQVSGTLIILIHWRRFGLFVSKFTDQLFLGEAERRSLFNGKHLKQL